jgi:hypothetical protein
MAQTNEPSDYDRQLRYLNRRLERLDDTQISPQEFGRGLDRVYAEIDALRSEMREMKLSMMEMNGKFDIIMRYITGSDQK